MKKVSATHQQWGKLATGLAIGALTMYFSDPDRGRRRRALVRDRVNSLAHKAGDASDVAIRDFGNRFEGMRIRMRRAFEMRSRTPDDQVIVASTRARLGREVAHPHAIEVASQAGHVVLSGQILTHEKPALLEAIRHLPGVVGVEDRLEAYATADEVPSLQGPGKQGKRSGPWQENWPPALRGAAVVGGGALSALGLAARTPVGALFSAAGILLLARGLTNRSLRHMAGMIGEADEISLQKTIEINALPETVFDIWTSYENFPYFMSHVLEVRDLGNQRTHWVVEGPAGSRTEWTAVQTAYNRPSAIAWKTEPGSPVEHHGSVLFEPEEDGRTRVTVRMHYRPPAGILGHALATLFGSDPKHQLDDDLMRMKSFIETGMPSHDAAARLDAGPQGAILH